MPATRVPIAGAMGALVLVLTGCSERASTMQPAEAIARVMEENHKASEALVHAARSVASRAGEPAAPGAGTATRDVNEGAMGSEERD